MHYNLHTYTYIMYVHLHAMASMYACDSLLEVWVATIVETHT